MYECFCILCVVNRETVKDVWFVVSVIAKYRANPANELLHC